MRWLNHTLAVLLVLGTILIVLAAGALFVLSSERGTQWFAARVLARTGPELTIGRVDGSLLGGFVLRDIRLRLTRDELDIGQLAAKWEPAAALLGEIAFRAVRTSAVAYRRLPQPPGADEGGDVLSLPFMLRLEDAIVESLSIDVEGSVLDLGETRFTGTYFLRHLTISRATSSTGPFELGANADLRFDKGIALATDIEWSGPVLGTDAAGHTTLNGDYPLLATHSELTAPFPAVEDGTLDFTDAMRFDIGLAWTGLVIPNVDHFVSPAGTGKLAGTIDAFRFETRGAIDVDGRVASVTGNGSGARGELVLENVVLGPVVDGVGAGTLRVSGTVSFARSEADLKLAAQDVNPRWIYPGLPGRVSGTGTLHTTFVPFGTRFGELALTGELRGYPVAIRGAAAVDGDNRWRLEALALESGPNRISVDGTLSPDDLDVAVAARVDSLDLLLPGMRGGLDGELNVAGTWNEPRARGHAEARQLDYNGYTLERIAVAGEGGLPADTPLDLTLDVSGVARGPLTVDSVHAALNGKTSAFRASFEARAADWQARAALSGGVADLTWRGALESLTIDEQTLGNWRLEESTRTAAGRSGVRLDNACLVHASGARGCAQLKFEGSADDLLVLSAQNVNLATLKPLLPPQLQLDGIYQLAASFADLGREPHGAAVLTGGTTHVRVAFDKAQAFATDITEARASATLEAGKLELGATVASSNGGHTNLRARIDDVRKNNSTISGSLSLAWPDLAFLALLSPELGTVAGALSLDLGVGGTVDAPTVDGRGGWSGGRVAVPEWGLVVDQIQATATSRDGRALVFDATGKAGDGDLKLTGTTTLDPAQGWPTRLKLSGAGVEAVKRADAQVFVSPDLDIDVALPDVRVTGAVLVPRAAIKISALPAQAVAPSPDAVVHGEGGPKIERPLRLSSRIDLKLGDDVRYSGLNLETRVTGGLRLDAEPNRSASASGTLTLAGTYNAYGQKLELERGLLLFNGPLDNPGLDVRAARTIETTVTTAQPIRVGVELGGTLKAPRTRVFSTPAMSEADALSYLLLGRPLTSAAGTETATLQTAALSMGLQQALPAVQRIGHSLGLDELAVQTTETDPGALMAGKYLSPKVYVRYTYGLFNRIGGLLLRFKVSNKVSIETRSGDQESMDVIYNVEKE